MAGESPGAKEAALFDRLALLLSDKLRTAFSPAQTSGNRLLSGIFLKKKKRQAAQINEYEDRFDLIVFDTAPTGHTLHLLSLPESMRDWMDSLLKNRTKAEESRRVWLSEGEKKTQEEDQDDPVRKSLEQRRSRFAMVRDILLDKANTSFAFVTNPASLAVSETERAIGMLEKFQIPVGGVIVNGIIPDSAHDGSGASFEYITSRMESQKVYIERIKKLGKRYPMVRVDQRDTDIVGFDGLKEIGEALFRELPV
jgi:arsenite-transporting ATPase